MLDSIYNNGDPNKYTDFLEKKRRGNSPRFHLELERLVTSLLKNIVNDSN